MSRRCADEKHVVAEVAEIAEMPGTGITRAEALLAPLHRLTRFDAARIALLDGARRHHPTLATRGYDDTIKQFLEGPEAIQDLELAGLLRSRRPLRMKDLSVRPSQLTTWSTYLLPAGFREGVALPLITADGRYLGVFGAATATARPLGDSACDLLQRLGPLIAHAVDPMRTVAALTSLVTDAVAGVVLTRAGEAVSLPGLSGHRLLTPGSPVLTEAAVCYADGDSRAEFLTPEPQGRTAPGYLKVTMLACPDEPPHDLTAVVVLRPPGDLRRLSHREMTMLGMVITGFTTARMAAELRISAVAVRAALEQARIKLGAPSCEAAVMRAADHGLYLPPAIALHRRQPPSAR